MNKIYIHEVGPRDGLQVEKKLVPLEEKIRWIEDLLASGIDIIQLGSFVHPKKVPQMADTDALFEHFSGNGKKPENVSMSGLVLNEKGLWGGDVLHGRFGQRDAQSKEHQHDPGRSAGAHHLDGKGCASRRKKGSDLSAVGFWLWIRRPDPQR